MYLIGIQHDGVGEQVFNVTVQWDSLHCDDCFLFQQGTVPVLWVGFVTQRLVYRNKAAECELKVLTTPMGRYTREFFKL